MSKTKTYDAEPDLATAVSTLVRTQLEEEPSGAKPFVLREVIEALSAWLLSSPTLEGDHCVSGTEHFHSLETILSHCDPVSEWLWRYLTPGHAEDLTRRRDRVWTQLRSRGEPRQLHCAVSRFWQFLSQIARQFNASPARPVARALASARMTVTEMLVSRLCESATIAIATPAATLAGDDEVARDAAHGAVIGKDAVQGRGVIKRKGKETEDRQPAIAPVEQQFARAHTLVRSDRTLRYAMDEGRIAFDKPGGWKRPCLVGCIEHFGIRLGKQHADAVRARLEAATAGAWTLDEQGHYARRRETGKKPATPAEERRPIATTS